MRFTTQAEYGLISCLHLARFGTDGPIAAREMAERESLPADYIEKILRRLRQAGIVSAVRGVSGGFQLARAPDDVSVREIIEATEGETFEINCVTHQVAPERCDVALACSIRPVWYALRDRIDQLLSEIKLGDLLTDDEGNVGDVIDVAWEKYSAI